MSTPKSNGRLGDIVWAKMPRVNGEVFTLTYGAMVMQVLFSVYVSFSVRLTFLFVYLNSL